MRREITMTMAERQIVLALMDGDREVSTETNKTIRGLRRDLDMLLFSQEMQHELKEAEKQGKPGLSWDEIMLLDVEGEAFSVDVRGLEYLQRRLGEHKWGVVEDREGKERQVPIPSAQRVVIEDLRDKVAEALGAEEGSGDG